MIIVKTILISIVLINLSCNNMNKADFKVFGEESLLKDCKINVSAYRQIGYDNNTSKYIGKEELRTLLFNGKSYEVESSEDDSIYIIYLSYKDSLVNILEYENVMGGEESVINHFYIIKNKDGIAVKFVGSKELLNSIKDIPSNNLITLEEFFRQKKINSEELKNKEKKLFFDFYGK